MATLLIGAPGTGKTYSLVNKILTVKPDRFALVSFTRRAAAEAKQRLRVYYKESELKNVQTIHSLCFHLLGLKSSQVLDWRHLRKFGNEYGYEFHGRTANLEDDSYNFLSDDDIEYREMMTGLARLEMPTSDMWRRYQQYKEQSGLIDFNDMIVAANLKIDLPKFDLVCVDEMQDLTPLQLSFIERLTGVAKQVIFAGDDNQMIFEWAGVDRSKFLRLKALCDVETLRTQYRIPGDIYFLASKIVGLVSSSYGGGDNIIHEAPSSYNPKESYLILARNGYILNRVARELEEQSIQWTYLNYEYNGKIGIKLSTIHASKGAEADNIILYTDVSPATYEHIDTSTEARVWYVAITRARKKLYLVPPETDCFYDLQ